MRNVTIESISHPERWLDAEPLTDEEVNHGIDICLRQIDATMDVTGDKFPWTASKDLTYPLSDCVNWTDGFWTGQLWMAYRLTGDEKYRDHAMGDVETFLKRVERGIELDHHDLGFLYAPSCVAAYRLTGSDKARKAALLAADRLMARWQPKGRFLQAWGPMGEPEHYSFIIDCLMNLGILYFAAEETGDARYRDTARAHLNTTCDNIIRDDGSTFHTFFMNPETGEPDHGSTAQGYSATSAWARGQSWGVYGLPLNMRHLNDRSYLPLWRAVTHYCINRLPADSICYWDLVFGDGSGQPRDSSAAAIVACGLKEAAPLLPVDDPDKAVYDGVANTIMRTLINDYTSDDHGPLRPILYHGVFSLPDNVGVDEGCSWGDYYFMKALTRYFRQE